LQSWEPEPIPPPPALALCFIRAIEPPLIRMEDFGEVYLTSACIPFTQVSSPLMSPDYQCMHDDAVEVTLKTNTPFGQECTRGGTRWKVDIAEHKQAELPFKYAFVKEPAPKLELTYGTIQSIHESHCVEGAVKTLRVRIFDKILVSS
jgi:hypothetical protein